MPVLGSTADAVLKAEQMTSLIAMALACDRTRAFNLMITKFSSYEPMSLLGIDEPWHVIAHASRGGDYTQVNRVVQWHVGVASKLCEKLAAIPEGAGTVLDNTIYGLTAEHGSAGTPRPAPPTSCSAGRTCSPATFTDGVRARIRRVKKLNDTCGTKVTVVTDFENWVSADWKSNSGAGYCGDALDAIKNMCSKPAYKKVLEEKLTGVTCQFADAKPKDAKATVATEMAMSFDKGVFTYRLAPNGASSNINDAVKKLLETELNK